MFFGCQPQNDSGLAGCTDRYLEMAVYRYNCKDADHILEEVWQS